MTDPHILESEGLDIDAGLSAAPPPARAGRRGARGAPARDLARDPSRGGVVVKGRNGEILTRKRLDDGKDIFEIPADLKAALDAEGYEAQWCAVSVVGNAEILLDQNLMLAENGWRAITSDRPGWKGRFMPPDHKGPIVRGSQMLMERPKALCDEARAEQIAKAKKQMRDRDEALMGGKAGLRSAVEGMKVPMRGGKLAMSIDPGLDIPATEYQLADDSVA